MKKEKIILEVELDDSNIPSSLNFQSGDATGKFSNTEVKAFLLSLFDKKNRETLKIDLWTKDMQVGEMDNFMFNTLKGLADTYKKATKNNVLADDFHQFVNYFGEKTHIIKDK